MCSMTQNQLLHPMLDDLQEHLMAQLAQAPNMVGHVCWACLTQMCGAVPHSIQPLLCKLGVPQ